MVAISSRIYLFNTICITARIGIILLLYFFPYQEMAILPGLLGLSFLYQYFRSFKSKKGLLGAKTLFGGNVYWPRLFHGMTYISAAILLLIEETREYAFWILVADVIIGFFIFWNHYRNIKFEKKLLL